MSEAMKTLGDFLRDADALNWRHALYLPPHGEWSEATPCAAIDPDECEAPEDDPPLAKKHGLRYAMGVSAVQDIVANALLQKPDADVGDLLDAFLFYYENDSFVSFL
jgi:hypothetical protein